MCRDDGVVDIIFVCTSLWFVSYLGTFECSERSVIPISMRAHSSLCGDGLAAVMRLAVCAVVCCAFTERLGYVDLIFSYMHLSFVPFHCSTVLLPYSCVCLNRNFLWNSRGVVLLECCYLS